LDLILDANALSAMAEGDTGLKPLLQGAATLSIPVIVLGEYAYGIRQLTQAHPLRTLARRPCRILVADQVTAQYYADIRTELKRAGRPIPSNDLWLAAFARHHNLILMIQDNIGDLSRSSPWLVGKPKAPAITNSRKPTAALLQ
jgi:tRNA(fMet)-specific endonuclease VapC